MDLLVQGAWQSEGSRPWRDHDVRAELDSLCPLGLVPDRNTRRTKPVRLSLDPAGICYDSQRLPRAGQRLEVAKWTQHLNRGRSGADLTARERRSEAGVRRKHHWKSEFAEPG